MGKCCLILNKIYSIIIHTEGIYIKLYKNIANIRSHVYNELREWVYMVVDEYYLILEKLEKLITLKKRES